MSKITNNENQLTFYGTDWGGCFLDSTIIARKSVVISAGLGSDTSFDQKLIEQHECFIVGIDPTINSKAEVDKLFSEGILSDQNFKLIRKALYSESGKEITLGGPAVTFLSTQGESVQTISLPDILLNYGDASVLKLDIEAAEYPVLQNLESFHDIAQLNISFHHWLNGPTDQYPSNNAQCPYNLKDTVECIKKIKSCGYKLVHLYNDDPQRYFQEVLFVRHNLSSNLIDVQFEYDGEII